ncbi:MAG: glucosaminidase domain-containing protein [Saprospiraceae bacterium]
MLLSLQKIVLVLLVIFSIATRPLRQEEIYVEQFKAMAISEMQRTGIPASIKLAQGLMESQSGRSELAKNANNHFGIKCKGDWLGETYDYKDDDTNVNGELIHSCFRKYTAAEQSYIDHSDFLTCRSRYKVLFQLDKNDYRSWAKGLKTCGYATDPNYADKLIDAIERLNLNNLDIPSSVELPIAFKEDNQVYAMPESPLKVNTPKPAVSVKSAKVEMTTKNLKKPVSKKRKNTSTLRATKAHSSPTDLLN